MNQTVLTWLDKLGIHPTQAQIDAFDAKCQLLQTELQDDTAYSDEQLALEFAACIGEDDTVHPREVYTMDGECMDVDTMYTNFLHGIAPMMPDAVFTDIKEDFSDNTDDMDDDETIYGMPTDGTITLSLLCNGHPYQFTFNSTGDWFNPEVVDLLNDMLVKEGCSGQLHGTNVPLDTSLLFVYGDRSKGEALMEISTHLEEMY